ncbi:hypothetical protein ACP4OV_005889 [Aristida adscensionis]
MSSAAADATAAGPAPVGTRRDKRRERKKQRRRRARREAAARARAAAEALAADPEEEERRLRAAEEAEAAESERARRAFEEAERRWLEAAAARAAEKAAVAAAEAEAEASSQEKSKDDHRNEPEEDGEWEYVEDGPAEIIWKGNEIIVKKKKIKIPKEAKEEPQIQEDRPTSNPLPPQSVAFASQRSQPSLSAQEILDKVAQETPNFGTEQDKAHCPFHLKTGACRFGVRCSRVHFYPDKSCTLLMKNMYNGPGLALEQDEGLEYTDEEVEQNYEEFYEDVHTEFLKFGELVNFKVCRNGSFHLRGNVYVHFKSLDSALLAYSSLNGRYFAGKQITCEFVALTRWKAAICGEYMRSRYKTCSHGVACNFIHCFRNPGGDYEWADWDNPPPKYWIRKMAALFGPSTDTMNCKASDIPDFERSEGSDRKRFGSSGDRYISRRSKHDDVHKRQLSRDHSHSKQEHSSHSMTYEHSRHRRNSSAVDKYRIQEIEDNTGKHFPTMENERRSHKRKHADRHRNDHSHGERDDAKIRSRKHGSYKRRSLEHGSPDWSSDHTDAEISKSPSGRKSSQSHDGHRSRRQSSEPKIGRHKSRGKEHNTKRCSSRFIDDGDYDEKDRGRDKSPMDHPDDSDDRWVATNSDVDSDAEWYERSNSRRNKRSGSRTTKSGTKDYKNRLKRGSKIRQHSTSEGASDSYTTDTSSNSSSDENVSTKRSRRRRQSKEKTN